MKARMLISTIATALLGVLVFMGSANAAQRVCDDGTRPPCDGGGDGGGMEPPDYGDLIILYRDEDGVPIPSPGSGAGSRDRRAGRRRTVLAAHRFSVDDRYVPSELRGRKRTPQAQMLLPSTSSTVPSRLAARAARRRSTSAASTRRARRMRCLTPSWRTSSSTWLPPTASPWIPPDGWSPAESSPMERSRRSTIDSPLQNLAIYRQLMLTGYHWGSAAARCWADTRHRGQGTWRRLRQDRRGQRGPGGLPQPDHGPERPGHADYP